MWGCSCLSELRKVSNQDVLPVLKHGNSDTCGRSCSNKLVRKPHHHEELLALSEAGVFASEESTRDLEHSPSLGSVDSIYFSLLFRRYKFIPLTQTRQCKALAKA